MRHHHANALGAPLMADKAHARDHVFGALRWGGVLKIRGAPRSCSMRNLSAVMAVITLKGALIHTTERMSLNGMGS